MIAFFIWATFHKRIESIQDNIAIQLASIIGDSSISAEGEGDYEVNQKVKEKKTEHEKLREASVKLFGPYGEPRKRKERELKEKIVARVLSDCSKY